MPRWAKALIIAGVLIVLLVIGVIGAGVYGGQIIRTR